MLPLQVLELVINWLKYDWEKRQSHAYSLLKKVRLGLVAEQNLMDLMSSDILAIPECRVLVEEVSNMRTSGQSLITLSIKSPEMFATRSTITVSLSY